MFSRVAKIYISWTYLVTLLENGVLAGFGAVMVIYLKGGTIDTNLILLLFLAAFIRSLLQQTGNSKILNLLLLIWKVLQQLQSQQFKGPS